MKAILEKLIEINLEINSILKSEKELDGEKLEKFLQEKNVLIATLKSLKESGEEEYIKLKAKYSESWKSLQKLEDENLNLIQKFKDGLGGEIQSIKIHVKAISSYKYKKDQEPRLFDDSF